MSEILPLPLRFSFPESDAKWMTQNTPYCYTWPPNFRWQLYTIVQRRWVEVASQNKPPSLNSMRMPSHPIYSQSLHHTLLYEMTSNSEKQATVCEISGGPVANGSLKPRRATGFQNPVAKMATVIFENYFVYNIYKSSQQYIYKSSLLSEYNKLLLQQIVTCS